MWLGVISILIVYLGCWGLASIAVFQFLRFRGSSKRRQNSFIYGGLFASLSVGYIGPVVLPYFDPLWPLYFLIWFLELFIDTELPSTETAAAVGLMLRSTILA